MGRAVVKSVVFLLCNPRFFCCVSSADYKVLRLLRLFAAILLCFILVALALSLCVRHPFPAFPEVKWSFRPA